MKTLDLSKFAARKDFLRPQMCGVFHDNGFCVASNTYVVVAVRQDYPADLEQKIIGRDGQEIKEGGRYPRWRFVFPDENEGVGYTVDSAAVRDLVRQERADKKGLARVAYVKAGNVFFRASHMKSLCEFMDAYGVHELRVCGPGRPAYVVAPDGSRAAISPALARGFWEEDRGGHLWLEL